MLVAAIVLSSACGGPCDECSVDTVCVDDTSCNQRCSKDGQCPIAGQGCMDYQDAAVCNGVCTQASCPDRAECIADRCVTFSADECGQLVPCEDAANICDFDPATTPRGRCLPRSGDCSRTGCPSFTAIQGLASIDCESTTKLCRTTRRALRVLGFPDDDIPILAPTSGQVFASTDALTFRWMPVQDAVMVNVFDGLPPMLFDIDELQAHLIWGAALPANHLPQVRWDEGFNVANGIWLPGTPERPVGGTLYFLVTAVRDGKAIAASDLIGFWSGDTPSWAVPGAPCGSDVAIPGTCDSPIGPLVCFQRQCRRLCSSDADCPTSFCDITNAAGFRVCGT
jgi:hypothetical protein